MAACAQRWDKRLGRVRAPIRPATAGWPVLTVPGSGAICRPGPGCPDINAIMIFNWDEILPAAIERLPPLHREILMYVILQPGKRRLSYAHANEKWGLTRAEFDVELAEAYGSVRRYLRRYGLHGPDDMEFRWP